jgi:hypothetical protein
MSIKLKKIILSIFALLLITGHVIAQSYSWSPLLQSNNINGVNGQVYAITTVQGNIVVAGGFTQAGGNNAKNIAVWNGTSWSALGSGIGNSEEDTVYALAVFNGLLFAGGSFSSAGGHSANNIAVWDGTNWAGLGQGVDGDIRAMFLFNNLLVIGGNFSNVGANIAAWTGTTWQQFGQGFNSNGGTKVYSLSVFNGQLIAAGKFQQSGLTSVNNIALWTGTSWQHLGAGIGTSNSKVLALTIFNNILIAGGQFLTAGGINAANIAGWSGSTWQNIGGQQDIDNQVDALASYNNTLIAGGNFRFVSGLYGSRVAGWNGISWSRMITGMDDKVNALLVKDTSLYAGGGFNYAGGYIANSVARWYNKPTNTISGQVIYADNNQPVLNGKVKSFRIDRYTKELIVVDSGTITNGAYIIQRNPIDTLRVIGFPNDDMDFVPTFYPTTVDWRSAVVVIPGTNLVNINIRVFRISPAPKSALNAAIGGHIYLNINIPGNPAGSYPYQSDAILYVKTDSTYNRFALSKTNEAYTTSQLSPGTYNLIVYRPGYLPASRTVTLGSTNLDTINFYLDTTSIIGLHNLSGNVPEKYILGQNYPNPFNPSTAFNFSIPKAGFVKISIYNILGEEIAVLVSENLKPGKYKYIFDAGYLPSGVYFYRLSSGDFIRTKKMVLIK